MKIVSLLPSTTEIICALDLEENLVAVTHECDYPPAVVGKPRITRSAMDHGRSTSAEIDKHISGALHRGSSIYHLDQELLERLAPELILTQERCDVCAVSYQQVMRSVRIAESNAVIASLDPNTVEDILNTILQVGHLTARERQAAVVVARLRGRIQRVAAAVSEARQRPRVLCLEWLDPVMVGGHWVPGMVSVAGGTDDLGKSGEASFHISWEQVVAYQSEVVVLMPCGFHLRENMAEFRRTTLPLAWEQLPAVREGQVFAVDGSSYFNRPGPRVVDGLEVLAQILHPNLMPAIHGPEAFCRLEF